MAQPADLIIDNGTGAFVRGDINTLLLGILTTFSGPTAPPATTGGMPWLDTTLGVLKYRNIGDTAWITTPLDLINGGFAAGTVVNGITVSSFTSGVIDLDLTSVAGDDTTLATSTAIKTYVDNTVSDHSALTITHGLIGDIVGTIDIQTLTSKLIEGGSLGSVTPIEFIAVDDLLFNDNVLATKLAQTILVLDPKGDGSNDGTVQIKGDLEVLGTTTTFNSTTVEIDDKDFRIASLATDRTGTGINTSGIILGAASGFTGTNPSLLWQTIGTRWELSDGLDILLDGLYVGGVSVINASGVIQTLGGNLDTIAALSLVANKMIYAAGAGTFVMTDLTAVARTFLAATTQAGLRAALGTIDISTDTNLVAGTAIALVGDTLNVDFSATNWANYADVTITSPVNGENLVYSGGQWVNGIGTSLAAIGDWALIAEVLNTAADGNILQATVSGTTTYSWVAPSAIDVSWDGSTTSPGWVAATARSTLGLGSLALANGVFVEDIVQFNISIGTGTRTDFNIGEENVLIGKNVGGVSTVTCSNNVGISNLVFTNLTSGSNNIAIGESSGSYITTGNYNIALGSWALGNIGTACTGGGNIAIGSLALGDAVTSGSSNTALGAASLRYLTTGTYNIAIGESTGLSVLSGSYNVAIGFESLGGGSGTLTGANNTAIGKFALKQITTTSAQNTAIGSEAGQNVTTGTGNIFLGYQTGSNITTGILNTCIGSGAGPTTNQSNQLFIDVATTDTPLIHGNFLTNVVTINGDLTVTGSIRNFRGALVFMSGAQSIANTTVVSLLFDTEEYDTDAIHSTVTNTDRLTVPTGVTKVRLKAQCSWAYSNGGSLRQTLLKKNGVDTFAGAGRNDQTAFAAEATYNTGKFETAVIDVVGGDYFTITAYHDKGAALSMSGTASGNFTWFAMEIIE